MQWNSISEFLHMGGYALYVWVSFGVTFGCMAIELVALRARRLRHLQNKLRQTKTRGQIA